MKKTVRKYTQEFMIFLTQNSHLEAGMAAINALWK